MKDFNFIYGSEDKLKFDNGMPKDPDDWLAETEERVEKCYDTITKDSRFYNLVKFEDIPLKSFKIEDNIDQKSREAWIKKTNFFLLRDYISQLLPHYDYDEKKTIETILNGGKKLGVELKKSKPITVEDI